MLAIAGGKGGVGRTTTAVGLAAALARRDRRPLVADADCAMPNLHAVADVPAGTGLAAVAAGESAEDAAVESARFDGVDVLAGGTGVDVRRALAALPRDRPAVVDCPAGARRAAAVPVRLADRAVVVTTPTPAAVRDAAKTAALARAVGTPVLGTVVVGGRGPPAGLADALDAPLLAAVPSADGRPLDESTVRAAHDRLAAGLIDLGIDDWGRSAGRRVDESQSDPGRPTDGVRPGNP